jgi:hypothetical protein
MKNHLSILTMPVILISVACNAMLLLHLSLPSQQADLSYVALKNNQDDYANGKDTKTKKLRQQELNNKRILIEATIAKNKKFNQELKIYLSQNKS